MYYQITGTSKHLGNIDIITKEIPRRIVEVYDTLLILEAETLEGFKYPFNCKVVCNKNRYPVRNKFPKAHALVENPAGNGWIKSSWAWFNDEYSFKIDDDGITTIEHHGAKDPKNLTSVDEIIEYVKNKYPVGLTWKGYLTEEDCNKLEECCEVHCVQPYMDGSAMYHFRYKGISR